MSRLFLIPAGRRSKWVVFGVTLFVFLGVAGAFAGKFEDAQKNETSSFLPGDAESVKALEAVERYPEGEVAPAVVIYHRAGGLTAADRAAIQADVRRLNTDRPKLVQEAARPIPARNGEAAIVVQNVRAPDQGDSQAFQDAVQEIRDKVSRNENGLEVKVTGGAGFSLDAI